MKVQNVKEYMSSIFQNYCAEIESLLPSQSAATKVKKRKTKPKTKEVPRPLSTVNAKLMPQVSPPASTTSGLSE